jgi:hypothetical protein
MRKKIVIAGLIVAVPVGLLVLAMVVEHVRGRIALRDAQGNLRRLDLQLSASEFKRPPLEENGAPALLKASAEIADGTALPNNAPPRRFLLPSGRAIVGFKEDEWFSGSTTNNNWQQVAADLSSNSTALANIASALEKPLRNELDLSLAPNLPFTHLVETKKPASWFAAAAQLALRDGHRERALQHLIAAVRLQRMVAEDRLLISELVRIAVAAIAQSATWDALQYDGWTDPELANLQKEWESRPRLESIRLALQGEIVFMHEAHQNLRRSHAETVKMLFWQDELAASAEFGDLVAGDKWDALPFGPFLKKQVYGRVWRFAWTDQSQARALQETRRIVEALQQASATTNLGPVLRLNETHYQNQANRSAYDQLRFPDPLSDATLGRAVVRAFKSETEAQMTVAAIGLKRYLTRHGKAPAALQDLVPEFLSSIPADYMDGTPLKYRATSDGAYLLYSSGENQVDDGGSSEPREESKALRNPWERLDVVWPGPASPGELEAYRAEQQRNAAKSSK